MGHEPPCRLAGILVVCGLLASEASAAIEGELEYPTSRLGVRTAPLLLLCRADVRAEVELTGQQATAAERVAAELHAKAAELRGKTGAEVLAARRAIDEAQQRWIDTQLSDKQRTRLIQIDLQWEGPAALVSRPVVAEALALSPQQRSTLSVAVAERNRKRDQGSYKQSDERLLAERALATLTAEQRDRWKAMLGRPFVPQLTAGKENHPR